MVASLPVKMIRKSFGGKEKEYRAKKGNFKKRCKARFLAIICRKNGVCVGRCMCPRNHGGKKR